MQDTPHYKRCEEVILNFDNEVKMTELIKTAVDGVSYEKIFSAWISIIWSVTVHYEDLRQLNKKEFYERTEYNQLQDVYRDAYNANSSVKDAKNHLFNQPLDFKIHFLACYTAEM